MSSSKTDKKKIVKCYYCKKEFEVHIYAPTNTSVCLKCKQEGKKCPNVTDYTIVKRKKTCLKKYGKENVSQNINIRQKISDRFKEKYSTPELLKERQDKIRQTCLRKYGVEHPLQFDEVKNKIRQTCLRKYGVEHNSQNQEVKEKKKQTSLSNYGTEYSFQAKEVKDKIQKIMVEKYGSRIPLKNQEIQNKFRQTCLDKYGCDWPSKSSLVKDKIVQICMSKYGVKSSLLDSRIQDKIKQTCLKKYGFDNASKSPEIKHKIRTVIRKNFLPKIKLYLSCIDLELISDYESSLVPVTLKCRICGTEFKEKILYLKQLGFRCPTCFPRNLNKYSKAEIEIYNFLSTFINENEIIRNTRSIISPLELDIYIPDKHMAIEYNGLYWHSEERNIDPNYHLNKTIECEKKGIQLIHIFEDEWIMKQEIVKSRLKQILNMTYNQRIHARQCEIKEIDSKSKNEFLEKFHIQGQDNSTIKLGAFYKNELVSVMTFSKPNISKGQRSNQEGIWELNRFCSNPKYHIPGIASKLLSYFKFRYEWKQIYSYADRRWSDGNLYHKLGFELDHITQPNYWYTKGFNRIHRFNLRKRPNEPKDIPEYILRLKEGYIRIWDCGNLKFSLTHYLE